MKIQTSSPRSLFIAARVLFLAGFALLCIAAFLTWRTSSFIQRSQTAAGTITALVPVSQHEITYAPVFSFKTADGQAWSVRSHTSSNPPDFAVNDSVTVLYDPSDPQHAQIDTFGQLWFVPILLGSMGTFSFIMAAGFVFTLRKLARAALVAQSQPSTT